MTFLISCSTVPAKPIVKSEVPVSPKNYVVHIINMDKTKAYQGTGFYLRHGAKTFLISNAHMCQMPYLTIDGSPIIYQTKDYHLSKNADLCAIEVDQPTGYKLAPEEATSGTHIHSMGYGAGQYSEKDCYITYKEGTVMFIGILLRAMTTNCKIIPGDSGSPALNDKDEVVAVFFGTHLVLGIGYAVPYDYIVQFLGELE